MPATHPSQQSNEPGGTATIAIVAGEHSGDRLGGKLMTVLNASLDGPCYVGVGGEDMAAAGLHSIFPMGEVAVMGPVAIAKRLPSLVRRVYQAVDTIVACEPDVLVIIDSPEFTHPIAKRVRKRLPQVPIIDYVSPSVWAWRPGRARKMRRYIDHVLALLPFEPAAHERLGGPRCTYVGHPLAESIEWVHELDPDPLRNSLGLADDSPVAVVLPGSRPSEVARLAPVFGQALGELIERSGPLQVIVPTVEFVREQVAAATALWPVTPHFILDETDKFRAFRLARAALAASGTVSLELGVAGTPMVVAYIVEPLATVLRLVIKAPSIVLANLVLERNAFPEFIQEDCTAPNLAAALSDLLNDSPERVRQLTALQEFETRLALPGTTPSRAAAQVVIDHLQQGVRPRKLASDSDPSSAPFNAEF